MGSVGGQIFVMVGVELLTVKFTVMVCALVAVAVPDRAMLIFPTYAVACGIRVVGSGVMVRICCSPGNTTPTLGVTDSHTAPEVAANEIGAPSVVNTTVCAATGLGGAVNAKVVGLIVSVAGGEVMVKVTATTIGELSPATVIVRPLVVYVPTPNPVGFTCRLRLAGRLPASGATVSQSAFGSVLTAVYAGVPLLALTETFWAAGSLDDPIS